MTEKSVVDIPIGSVVLANAGRDKGRYFVAVAASGGFVYIADGKERKLEKPKVLTQTVLQQTKTF